VYYDDSEDDMEDFQWHPKKLAKMMKGMKVSVIMCYGYVLCAMVIIHYIILYTFPCLFYLI
jgi:t-SNARE complex subunit (syntaxin)